MQNLLTSAQIREADAHTISTSGISSLSLMEMAASAFASAFRKEVPGQDTRISVYAGTGNNGGDGLAIARILKEQGYDNLEVNVVRFQSSESDDFLSNLERLKFTGISVRQINTLLDIPDDKAEVLIDAILGSGLNKSLEGNMQALIRHLNSLDIKVIAVDIPTGFPSEGPVDPQLCVLKADLTITFQRPKLNFFFPESTIAMNRWEVVNIGLDEEYIQSTPTAWKLIEESDIRKELKPRPPFSHKGTFGHALIVAGDTKTLGAAIITSDACLHSGAGLTTACIPDSGCAALNSYCPEVMYLPRNDLQKLTSKEKYQAIGLGPGLGTSSEAVVLLRLIAMSETPLVIDADALTILADHPELLRLIPSNSILTPHMKEFDRLFGRSDSWWERVLLAIQKAGELNVSIILKNRYSFIVLPNGNVFINPTGNAAMAIGGTGDILTGIVTAFLAQGYPADKAAMLAVYIHGKAGDELNEMYSIPARYLIRRLPELIGSMANSV